MIVFGAMSGHVFALSKKTGALLWNFAMDGASLNFANVGYDRTGILCSPSISHGIVTIGGRDGFLYALDLKNGKEKWRNNHNGSWVLGTAIKDSIVFAGSGSSAFVQALNLFTGKEIWRFKTPVSIFTALSIAGDMIYFGDYRGNLHALNNITGKEKWHFPIGDKIFSTPIVSEGNVYCGSDKGVMYALEGETNQADTSSLNSRKIVYWEGPKSPAAYRYFQYSFDIWTRDYLKGNGFELMDSIQLKKFLVEQLNAKWRSVVVFSDNKLPSNIVDSQTDNALIRRYLNAMGKIVFLGLNPLAFYCNNPTGELDSISYNLPGKIFGIQYPFGGPG